MVSDQLRARGIADRRVLDAMGQLPREVFVPPAHRGQAYQDAPIPIGEGQTISQPYIVAYMTEALAVEPESRVLEIGTGSGYQAGVLAMLTPHVLSVERVPSLLEGARARLEEVGLLDRVQLHLGDGTGGLAAHAPYDRILITAGAPGLSDALVDQLAPGGVLVAPVGDEKLQHLVRIVRLGTQTSREQLIPCRFVKLIGEAGWPEDGPPDAPAGP
jgi:protein-L-isoaspartate(D-aspartate) O-methyltransferase